ncbi:MAG: VOC family protein [Propionibacteriaceae bacterium]
MTPSFDAVEIVVSDMARSLAFYRRLGLDLPTEADADAHVEITLPGGLRLAFDTEDTIRSFDPHWTRPTSGGGRQTLAFRCADPAEVDRTYAELTATGVTGHLEPWDAVWGMRYAVVRDPDGHGIDLFADLAAT